MRTLAIIPIIHTERDLGALKEDVRRATERAGGAEAWERKQAAVEELWRAIGAWADALDPGAQAVRVYQDGLPVCGKERDIVADLAGKDSINHVILQRLIDRGAQLEGTESPDLLMKEYELVKGAVGAASGAAGSGLDPRHEARARTILEARDAFIAQRIDETLQPGELGVLFLGLLHNVRAKLADDIEVREPVGRPEAA
jgi:hypothetical protein